MKSGVTTIQVSRSVVEALNKVKRYDRETYSEVIANLIDFIKGERERREFERFVMAAQKEKMQEVWGTGDYKGWENV